MKSECWRTEAEPLSPRTEVELEGRWSQMGRSTAEGLDTHGEGRATTDQCKAGSMRIHGGVDGLKWRDGHRGSRQNKLVNSLNYQPKEDPRNTEQV